VTEALGLRVAVVVLEALVLLGAVVPGELEETFVVGGEAAFGHALGAGVAEEVQVEAGGLLLDRAEKGHTHSLLVELEGLLGILDTDHGVVLFKGVSARTFVLLISYISLGSLSIEPRSYVR
jgi:hypothetical protein